MLILQQPFTTQPSYPARPVETIGGQRVVFAYNAACAGFDVVRRVLRSSVGAGGDLLVRPGPGGRAAYSTGGTMWQRFDSPTTGADYTVISLFKAASAGTTRVITAQYTQQFYFYVSLLDFLLMRVTSGGQDVFAASASTISTDRIYVGAGRCKGTEVSVWLNGKKDGTNTITATTGLSSANKIDVGALATGNQSPFGGDIYGIVIIDGAVPDTVIAKFQTPADFWRMFQARTIHLPTAGAVGGGGFKAAWVRPQSRVIGSGVR